jgi:hypothetical protein
MIAPHDPILLVMAHPPQCNRGWWREYFEDHPGLKDKTPESFTNPSLARPDKQKVWCKQCFTRRIAAEKARDSEDINLGKRVSPRDEATIRNTCGP